MKDWIDNTVYMAWGLCCMMVFLCAIVAVAEGMGVL